MGLAPHHSGLHRAPALGRRGELDPRRHYVVVEQSPALAADVHDRRAPGLNHLAFHGGTRDEVDQLVAAAPAHGWVLLFPDRHPHAGGPDHYAAYLEFLLRTGSRVLVEASPRGRIWGIGTGAKNENAKNPAAWRGLNLLGFALMEARERLRG